ncbi:uncharacterized protein LOC117331578 isoform X2 [Pecten maximus]|nr:uncharacterized protein LOC117331578 isoform X2 [Pecten maximus]
MFALLEIRKQRGFNRRHFLVNGFISGFVGLTIARFSKIEECKKRVLERFPNGGVARMESSMNSRVRQNQVESNKDSLDSSQDSYEQRDDRWSGSSNYNTSDSEQYPENASSNKPDKGMTWREAREKYRAGTLPGKSQQNEESGFFTDTDSAPRSKSGQNKYGDSWDTSN